MTAAAVFFALALARLREAATKHSNPAPDRELLKIMELLRQMEVIQQIEMLRDMDRLDDQGATAAPRKAQAAKKPERPK